jgi:membrane protein DedA with SNARE-associated domain
LPWNALVQSLWIIEVASRRSADLHESGYGGAFASQEQPMGAVHQILTELTKHGYVVLFFWVTAEQLGAPLPAAPMLLAAGVLSATGHLSFIAALSLVVLGCLIGDTAWYAVGRRWGTSVLHILCKISLEPESCVRRGSDFVSRYGGSTLLMAKFIPGVNAVAIPLAASSGISLRTFFLCDLLGSVFYAGVYLTLGWMVGDRIERVSQIAHSITGASVGFALLAAIAILIGRWQQRRRFRRHLRISRITPQELFKGIERGQNPFIVDLRHPLDKRKDPRVIPGAIHIAPREISARRDEIPLDREVVLYCT